MSKSLNKILAEAEHGGSATQLLGRSGGSQFKVNPGKKLAPWG
jgi:hypothetical protein